MSNLPAKIPDKRVWISGDDGLVESKPKSDFVFTKGRQNAALRLILIKLKESLKASGFKSVVLEGDGSELVLERGESLVEIKLTTPLNVVHVTSDPNGGFNEKTKRPNAKVTRVDTGLTTPYVLRVVRTEGSYGGRSANPIFIPSPKSVDDVKNVVQALCATLEDCFKLELNDARKVIEDARDIAVEATKS